jgi:hypothetical protein
VDDRAQRRVLSHGVKEIQYVLKWVSYLQLMNF